MVVRTVAPAVPVMVVVVVPIAAEAVAVRVKVEVQVGVQDVSEKEAVTPDGNPDAEKDAAWAVPVERVAVMVLVTLEPWVTLLVPPLLILKSKAILLTVTDTVAEVVVLPAASRVRAVSAWEALVAVVVFQTME